MLTVKPDILERVSIHQHTPGVFELKQVLDRPFMMLFPRQRFDEVVASDLYVRGDQSHNLRVGTAKYDCRVCEGVLADAQLKATLD